ncbi:hypothetical protein ABPG74_020431 [Tetrahymena malaccensis]
MSTNKQSEDDILDSKEEILLDSKQQSVFSEPEYREYPQRITTLIGFILVASSYLFTLNVFNPISANVSDIYDVPPLIVNLNSLMQNILFLPVTFPVSFVLEKFGMRASVYIAAVIIIASVWIRLLVNVNYYYTLLAHIMMGLGFPFTQNMVTKLSLVWFRTDKRQMITQILMVLTMVVMLISSLLPGLWMKDYDEKADQLDGYKTGKSNVFSLMKIQAIVVTVISIIGCIIFKEKPPTPPSFTAEQKREDMGPSIKLLLKSKNYLLTLICYGLFCGNFLATGVTMSFIFKPYGYGSDTVSFAGVGIVVSGVIGSGIGGKLFRIKPRFRLYIMIAIIGSITGFGLTLIFLPIENKIMVLVPYMIVGLVSLQAFPIFLELASEIAYPVSETVSSGILLGGSHLLGFAFGNIYSAILGEDTKAMVMVVQVCNMSIFFVCLVILKFLKVELNRTKVDAQHESGLKIVDQNNEDVESSSNLNPGEQPTKTEISDATNNFNKF